ncbi:hypothetical protein N7486_009925 [Penicillium sp. IBT 16267x]|nr:hypothetical protein N7486_009925 [Penicillium sp. IBT 16267x]
MRVWPKIPKEVEDHDYLVHFPVNGLSDRGNSCRKTWGRDETKALHKCYEDVLALIIGKCKVVATTLNSSGEEALRISKFEPFALLCDEAG